MSNYTFPDLQGADIQVERTEDYSTTVHTSVSGQETRTAWWSSPIYRYVVRLNVLRESVSIVTDLGTFTELGAVRAFHDQHRGQWDSFNFVDPVDGVTRRVRFDDGDSLTVKRIAAGLWSAEVRFRMVK